MNVKFDRETTKELNDVISLYKKFDKYKDDTREELYYHLLPSFKFGQYKTFKENNNVVAFTNWAYFDTLAEKHYKKTGEVEDHFWKSGNVVWVIDVVSKINGAKVIHWLRNKFKKGKWMRLDKNNKPYRIGKRNI